MTKSDPDSDIATALRQARRTAIQRAIQADRDGEILEKVQWQERRRYADQLLAQFQARESAARTAGRQIFVSYSKGSGAIYFELLKAALQGEGFEVVTGFDGNRRRTETKTKATSDTVLGKILSVLRPASLYCGILTKELSVTGGNAEVRAAPGVWIVEEKGMALALGKPSVFLIEDGIHEDFWRKTTPEKLHFTFKAKTYPEQMLEAVGALKDRYEDLVLRSLADGMPLSGLEEGPLR